MISMCGNVPEVNFVSIQANSVKRTARRFCTTSNSLQAISSSLIRRGTSCPTVQRVATIRPASSPTRSATLNPGTGISIVSRQGNSSTRCHGSPSASAMGTSNFTGAGAAT